LFVGVFIFILQGPLLANDLLLRSKQLNAQEALQARMINEIIPSSTKKNSFLPQVLRQVDEILASKVTQKSLPIFKSLLRRWRDPAIHEAIRIEFLHLDRQFLNGDLQEAIQQVVQSIGTKKKSNPQSKL
jgi:enoyl-CoA hydratase/carnithine racemase